jgi:hypothetical protein
MVNMDKDLRGESMSTLLERRSAGLSGWAGSVREAVPLRTLVLVVAVLGIQLGFIGSYVGAFHSPALHRVRVALAAPPQVTGALAAEMDDMPGHPLQAVVVASGPEARHLVDDESVDGALVVAAGSSDHVLVASADGGALSQAVAEAIEAFARAGHQSVAVSDIRPANPGDNRGLTSFYLVVGWCIGGYLVASMLAVSIGARPASRRRALARLYGLAVYAVLSGVGGALIVDRVGALTGHTAALAAFGMLLVFAVGALSVGLEALCGVVGIGVVIVLLVVLGNPSAGGAYQSPLLPTFWRAMGAGVSAVRTIAYFPSAGIIHELVVVVCYAAVGLVVTLAVCRNRAKTATAEVPGSARGVLDGPHCPEEEAGLVAAV